jgi:two-component system, OmpR family, sensor histidine kinase BaeS
MSGRLVAVLMAITVIAVIAAEALLSPVGADRWRLLAIIAGPAVVAIGITPLLARWVSSRASVAGVALTVGLCSLSLGAITSSAASNAMFVSSRDYRLFLVLLMMSSAIALVVGAQLTRPLARDVQRLGEVAEQVAGGDLSVRTGIERHDEVGATATALDTMVDALAAAEDERMRLDAARRLLFSSIGHDLRTPLSALRAAVESLQDEVATDPVRTLATMHTQVSAMDAMLDQLVEYTRLEAGHVTSVTERVSLAELIDDAVDSLAPLLERRVVACATAYDGPGIVDGSPLELSRVIRNLLDNAVRHSPNGGTVRVALATTADHVEFTVADDGPGFPPEFRSAAFEPFRRADPSRNASTGNAGLGLAICKAIVDAHGGTIEIVDPSTTTPSGASIVVQLPLARRTPPARGTRRAEAHP